jgi:lysophospholipase L1-like esterase
MTFTRYIALGDSFTEGMTDEIVNGEFRGWADRIADVMGKQTPDFTYMSLAVRGKLLPQVLNDQVSQIAPYVEGKQTLVSFHAGANDVIRPNYNPAITLPLYLEAAQKVAATGCTLMLFTVMEQPTSEGKTGEIWQSRFHEFNKIVRHAAELTGAVLIDWNVAPFLSDLRFLAVDRLHLNEEGHYRVAQGVLEKLGLPFDASWKIPPPPAPKISKVRKVRSDIRWIFTFVIPWIWRRARGRSSGDGRSPKYPTPIRWPRP